MRGVAQTYVIAAVIVGVLIVAGMFFLLNKPQPAEPQAYCGDGKCDASENCASCEKDCGCSSGRYCSAQTYTCTKPTCGNGVCELFENPASCCSDCGCYNDDELCSNNICETFVSQLTDKDVENAIRAYYSSKNMEDEILNISEFVVTNFENKPGRGAMIELKNDHPLGGILQEDGTLIIMEKTSVIDRWKP